MQRSFSALWSMWPGQPPLTTKPMQGAQSLLPFLKYLLNRETGHNLHFAKQGETLNPTAGWEVVLWERTAADGLSCYSSFCTTYCPRARQGCRTREIRESEESCAAHTPHATTMLHKAGETSSTLHKRPEPLSAEKLGI